GPKETRFLHVGIWGLDDQAAPRHVCGIRPTGHIPFRRPQMIRSLAAALCLSTGLSSAIVSRLLAPEAIRSKPVAQVIDDATPVPADTTQPGDTIRLEVDATDTAQRIFRVRENVPVAAAGPMTLLMPAWLPGNHAPRGTIDKLAGLTFTADGK